MGPGLRRGSPRTRAVGLELAAPLPAAREPRGRLLRPRGPAVSSQMSPVGQLALHFVRIARWPVSLSSRCSCEEAPLSLLAPSSLCHLPAPLGMSGGYIPSESGQSEGAWAALLSVLGQSVKSFAMSRPVTMGRRWPGPSLCGPWDACTWHQLQAKPCYSAVPVSEFLCPPDSPRPSLGCTMRLSGR